MKKKKTQLKDFTLSNMRRFHASVDWIAWWEEWYLTVGDDGYARYKSVRQFARAKAKNEEQKKFLVWYLGPKPKEGEVDELAAVYRFVEPQEWYHKRETGGWCTEAAIQQATKEFKTKLNAIEKLNEVGDKYSVRFLYRIEMLAQRLDQAFLGKLMLPGVPWVDNVARSEAYLKLLAKLQGMHSNAVITVARTLGVNFDNMEGLTHLIEASRLAQQSQQNETQNRLANTIESLVQMHMIKAERYGTPLAEPIKNMLLEAKAEKLEEKTKVKKGVM